MNSFKIKSQKIKHLIQSKFTEGSSSQLIKLDDEFVNAWYEAATTEKKEFVLNGKKFSVIGGKETK